MFEMEAAAGPATPPAVEDDAPPLPVSAEPSPSKSPDFTTSYDDFLTIVPKPTLLSKEKAKKRLQAFSLSKLNAYYNHKKKEAENAAAIAAQEAAEEPACEPLDKVKKKAPLDTARETVEEIEKCKLEQVQLLLQGKVGDCGAVKRSKVGKRTRSVSEDGGKHERDGVEARRDRRSGVKRTRSRSPRFNNRERESKRGSFRGAEQQRSLNRQSHHRDSRPKETLTRQCKTARMKSPVKDTKEKDSDKVKDRATWSDYDENYMDHPEEKDVSNEIFDIRKMLLFNSTRYNIRPYQYKKVDGSVATIASQFLRFTTKSPQRIAYSCNSKHAKPRYFQLDELFSIIPKAQKESFLALIAQAAQMKPIAPSKAASERNWYRKDHLVELHADETIYYEAADLLDVVEYEPLPEKDESKPERKMDREDRRKRHKHDKEKRKESAVCDESVQRAPQTHAKVAAGANLKPRKRTDSHKSDTNSINSIDKALTNHVSLRVTDVDEHNSMEYKSANEDPKTPPLRHSTMPSAAPMAKDTYASKKHLSRSSEKHKTDHSTKNNQLYHVADLVDGKYAKDESKTLPICKYELSDFTHGVDRSDLKSYSKKLPPLPLSLAPLTTPTKIYKIKNDCIDTLDRTLALPVHTVSAHLNDKHQHEVAAIMSDETIDNKPLSAIDLLNRFEKNMTVNAKVRAEERSKEPPIEKLKTKPSELYSPTLQSLTSESSNSDVDMPDTNEYKSHWESDEEADVNSSSNKSMDNAWESEDEAYPMVATREIVKPKVLHERSLEMPLNISFSRQRSQIILPKETPELKLFEDLDGGDGWDLEPKHAFELKPDVNSFELSAKPNLEDEYMQFMSSVSNIEEATHIKRPYRSSSSSSTSSSSSSSSDSGSSSDEEIGDTFDLSISSEVLPTTKADAKTHLPLLQGSPVCNVNSTSSPTVMHEKKAKVQLSMRKPLPAIVLAKKSPLIGCSLFRDDDSDTDPTEATNQTAASKSDVKESPRQSPASKRYDSPRRTKQDSPSLRRSSTVRHYSSKNPPRNLTRRDASPKRVNSRDRRTESPKRDGRARSRSPARGLSPKRAGSLRRAGSPRRGSPRRGSSPRRGGSPRRFASPKRAGSPRRLSPRIGSPKLRDSRDSSPKHKDPEKKSPHDCRRRESSPRHKLSPRRRSPKHRDGSRSPKHDAHIRSPKNRERSPRSIDLPRHHDHDRDKRDGARNRDERYRDRDRKYRDGSPRYRESPSRTSPSRRRSPARHRCSPKRDRSPRYRDRSPRRRSHSPARKIYSRSTSKESKHESIAKALHRLAGMDYDPPKSPGPINSPMDAYLRGVPDSTISDEQLLKNCGAEFSITSPVYFNPVFKPPESGSPKRIPLDDRINQVLGIGSIKQPSAYSSDPYYNQMYYDQYGNAMPANSQYDQSYKHYNQHLAANNVSNKVLQVGNVLQVVPTEQQHSAKIKPEVAINANNLHADMAQKFVPVGNMLEIVPTMELPSEPVVKAPVASAAPPTIKEQEAKLAQDLLKIRTAERKAEREKRRQDRERRRKEKELKRKEREQRRQLKFRQKSEAMIKKALMFDAGEEGADEVETKVPFVSMDSSTIKAPKGILIVRQRSPADDSVQRSRKRVKFADGVLPGEGTSPSGGEELSSPPPFSKVPKEKRFTKTKKPKKAKHHKKKIKVKIVRSKKKAEDADDNLSPPSPPPGSPPPHIFPPRVKPTLINPPAYYANYSFNAMTCAPFPPEAPHPPFPGIPNMQYPPMTHLHLPPGSAMQPLHPIPLLLPPPAPSRLIAKPLSKSIDKSM